MRAEIGDDRDVGTATQPLLPGNRSERGLPEVGPSASGGLSTVEESGVGGNAPRTLVAGPSPRGTGVSTPGLRRSRQPHPARAQGRNPPLSLYFPGEEVEFDRGDTWTRFKTSLSRKKARAWGRITLTFTTFVRSCGFLVDEIDTDRVMEESGTNIPVECWPHNVKLGCAIVCLTLVTALEPVLLKVMSDHAIVDELRDYRYLLAQLLVLSHLPLAVGSGLWYACKHHITTKESCAFPKLLFVLLAFLNALHMIMLVVPVGSVPGPLVVLLVHTKIPFEKIVAGVVALLVIAFDYIFPVLPQPLGGRRQAEPISNVDAMLHTQYGDVTNAGPNRADANGFTSRNAVEGAWFPGQDGDDSNAAKHSILSRVFASSAAYFPSRAVAVSGSLILIGTALAVYPIFDKDASGLGRNSQCFFFNEKCQDSTIIFLLSSIPAALSSLVLEKTLVQYSLPVPPLLLHSWVVPMQFVFGTMLAPVGRHFQNPTRPWNNISDHLVGIDIEFQEGLRCILYGEVTGMGLIHHSDPEWCKPLLPLLILFVAVSFSFHMLTLHVAKNGTELSLRLTTILAVPLGWCALVAYENHFRPNVDPVVPTNIVISNWSKAAMVFVVLGIYFNTAIEEPHTDFVLTSRFEDRDTALAESHRVTLESRIQGQREQQDIQENDHPGASLSRRLLG